MKISGNGISATPAVFRSLFKVVDAMAAGSMPRPPYQTDRREFWMPSFCRWLRRAAPVLGALLTATASPGAPVAARVAGTSAQETIVFLRHGEKPEAGLGQLDCKGLNRSLALPAVLSVQFGRPDAIFAPNPSKQKDDSGALYDYVRPLATIEPTAIADGLPVDTTFGYDDIDALQAALALPQYRNAMIFVAWEHKQIVKLTKALLKANGGDAKMVPKWPGSDFDGLYVVRIKRTDGQTSAAFERRSENLEGQPDTCPSPAG